MSKYKNVPVEVVEAPEAEPEVVPADEIVLTPALAALALRAYTLYSGGTADAEDNQAERLVDGTVRMYLRQPDRSHKRVYVSIPDSIVLKLAPAPEL